MKECNCTLSLALQSMVIMKQPYIGGEGTSYFQIKVFVTPHLFSHQLANIMTRMSFFFFPKKYAMSKYAPRLTVEFVFLVRSW